MNKPTDQFYWQSRVSYGNQPTQQQGGGCTSSGKPTQAECLADAFQLATYYLVECGYRYAHIEVEQICMVCHGQGTVRRSRKLYDRKPCPQCKGKPKSERLEFQAELHENILRKQSERETA